MTLFALVVALCFLESSFAFNMKTSTITRNVARIKMEYIPDGISKEKVSSLILDTMLRTILKNGDDYFLIIVGSDQEEGGRISED